MSRFVAVVAFLDSVRFDGLSFSFGFGRVGAFRCSMLQRSALEAFSPTFTFTLFLDPVFKLYKPSIMCTFVQWLGKDFRHLYICILIAVKNWFEVQTLARW